MDDLQLDPGAPQGDGQDPQGQPAQDSFNPQEFGFQFRHETVYPKDRNELTELLQLGRSYKENKVNWETERNQYAQIKPKYEQYNQFEQALQKNPEFAKELQALAQKYSQSQAQPGVAPEILTELQEIRQWKADQDLSTEMSALEQKYSTYDWKKDGGEGNLRRQVLIFMRDNQIPNAEMAFRAMMFEQAKKDAQFQGAKTVADATQAQARRGAVVGGGAKPPATLVKRANGYGQAADFSLAELGIT